MLADLAVKMLSFAALVTWLGSMFLFEHYSYTRPTIANAAEGRVLIQNNHGYYTYLTGKEHYFLLALVVAAPVLFGCAVLIGRRRTANWFR